MDEGKKRPYRSALRDQQAALTRERILDAAEARFTTEGYGRTTIASIAEVAGVAVDTVYAVFGAKARVLTAVIDRRLAPTSANVTDRDEAQAVRDEPDPRRQLQLFARDMAAVSTRVRPIYEILRTAAAVEAEMAAVHAEMDGYRLRNMTTVAGWITARAPLRVDTARAGEIIWALASPDVGRLLCDIRGWTEAEHAEWLEQAFVDTLLDPGA